MNISLVYGNRTIRVHVALSQRKRLSITVHPDCSVTAKAPEHSRVENIENKIRKRAKWIVDQLTFFEAHQPAVTPRQYINGETHIYLGRQYRLRIRTGKIPRVRLIGRYFELEMPDTEDREQAARLMRKWHKDHARLIIESRVALFMPRFRCKGAPEPMIRYRLMKKRWGSCNKNGVIMFNTELAKAPLDCVDYVVVHELCHLLCPHHDQDFFRLIKRVLPDWERRKDRLEKASL